MATTKSPSPKKLSNRGVKYGRVFITASSNNTIVSITDENGAVMSWASSGSCGFKGSRKSTPYAAQVSAEKAAEKAKSNGLEEVDVCVKGIGNGREQAVRGLIAAGLVINKITDRTPVPHNGCRRKGARRV